MPLKLKVIFTKKYDFLFARVWFHGLWGIKCNSLLTESLCRIKIYYSNVEFVKIQALLKGVEIELSQKTFICRKNVLFEGNYVDVNCQVSYPLFHWCT